ncbi:hypothetical protein [Frateuria defendens]|uniref:hypothetical protein n=1 Tax=Frateuria defendens TaxID=2219559 RepID=UPI00066FBDB7|nr:hypothetical protein [Frateuria defendens]
MLQRTAALPLLLAAALAIGWSPGTPAATADAAAPSDADLAGKTCSISEERFLPADYYYCLAAQTYGQGRYREAQRFFATAAGWASKPAQYVLGVMALHGDHQPANRPLALAWLALAAERHREDFEAAYRAAYASASPTERAQADTLLGTMRATYGDDVAATRAERRYRDGMAAIEHADRLNSIHCLSGIETGGRSAVNSSNPAASSVACAQVPQLTQVIDRTAAEVFDGWSGHVSVGPLQQAGTAAPAGPQAH